MAPMAIESEAVQLWNRSGPQRDRDSKGCIKEAPAAPSFGMTEPRKSGNRDDSSDWLEEAVEVLREDRKGQAELKAMTERAREIYRRQELASGRRADSR